VQQPERLGRLRSPKRKGREEGRLPLLKLFLSMLVRKRDRRIVLMGWKERQFITWLECFGFNGGYEDEIFFTLYSPHLIDFKATC